MNDKLRQAIRQSGKSLYSIAKESGVKFTTVQGFVGGANGATLTTAERLAPAIGLELRLVKRRK